MHLSKNMFWSTNRSFSLSLPRRLPIPKQGAVKNVFKCLNREKITLQKSLPNLKRILFHRAVPIHVFVDSLRAGDSLHSVQMTTSLWTGPAAGKNEKKNQPPLGDFSRRDQLLFIFPGREACSQANWTATYSNLLACEQSPWNVKRRPRCAERRAIRLPTYSQRSWSFLVYYVRTKWSVPP